MTINQQINLANYCGGEKILLLRGFSIAEASAPVAAAVPTPMSHKSAFHHFDNVEIVRYMVIRKSAIANRSLENSVSFME